MLCEHAGLTPRQNLWLTALVSMLVWQDKGASDADAARFGRGLGCVLAFEVGLPFGSHSVVEQCAKPSHV